MNLASFISQSAINSVPTASTQSDDTHKLIYRGSVYEVPKQPIQNSQSVLEQMASLVGKKLIYRGSTYQIMPTEEPTMTTPKTVHRLIYRGLTFEKAI